MNPAPFRNSALAVEERVRDLISRLTLEEKCAQLGYDAPAIDRLGIPAYNWWNEALHGVGRAGRATVFPQAIGLAATFDADLVEEVASAIGDEARAKHHEARRQGSRQQYQGLTFWTPNINIFRDPRWGRGQETWGEDPFLTGELGAAFVRGLQGKDSHYLKTAACAKHYAVHSGPEGLRHEFDARPPKKDFEETYLPAFKRLVDEGVESVMGAYNRVYGEPCCGSELLLKKILRERWGFKGHVVSDCWAIRDFHTKHKVTETVEESAAMAIRNGCDLNCGSVYCDALLSAVQMGLCGEEDIDRALANLLRTQFKLGFFDPEESVPYSGLSPEIVAGPEHADLARRAARDSIVLLKNAGQALPLRDDDRYMVVCGPHAASVEALLGNYFGMSPKMSTVLEGLAGKAPESLRIDYRKGCQMDRPNPNPIDWCTFEAAQSDVVVAAMGIDPNLEGEEGDAIQSEHKGDRVDSGLPDNQVAFVRKIADHISEKKTGARLVVLLFGGSPLSIPEIHEAADAVLQVWYPGQAGGEAIAEILFGDASPCARMPFGVPFSIADLPEYDNYSMAGRTYKYMDPAKMLYPFGFGLSYANFHYAGLELSATEIGVSEKREATVVVENTGPVDGTETVQFYLSPKEPLPEDPAFRLVGVRKVRLAAGERTTVRFAFPGTLLCRYTAEGEQVPAFGTHVLHVAGALPVARSRELGTGEGLKAEIRLKE